MSRLLRFSVGIFLILGYISCFVPLLEDDKDTEASEKRKSQLSGAIAYLNNQLSGDPAGNKSKVIPEANVYNRPAPVRINSLLDSPGSGAVAVLPDAAGGFLVRWSGETLDREAGECYQIARMVDGVAVGLVLPARMIDEPHPPAPLSEECTPENSINYPMALIRTDERGALYEQNESVIFGVIERRKNKSPSFLNATNITLNNGEYHEIPIYHTRDRDSEKPLPAARARRNRYHYYNAMVSVHYNKPAEILSLVSVIRTRTFDQARQFTQIDIDLKNKTAIYRTPGVSLRLTGSSSENANLALFQHALLITRMLELDENNPVRSMLEACRSTLSYEPLAPIQTLIVPGTATDTYTREFMLFGESLAMDEADSHQRYQDLLQHMPRTEERTAGVVLELRDTIDISKTKYALQYYLGADGESRTITPGRSGMAIYFQDEARALAFSQMGSDGRMNSAPVVFVFSAVASFVSGVVIPQLINYAIETVKQKIVEEVTKRIPVLRDISRVINQIQNIKNTIESATNAVRQVADFFEQAKSFRLDQVLQTNLPGVEIGEINFRPGIEFDLDFELGEQAAERNLASDNTSSCPGVVSVMEGENAGNNCPSMVSREKNLQIAKPSSATEDKIKPGTVRVELKGSQKIRGFYQRLCELREGWGKSPESSPFNQGAIVSPTSPAYSRVKRVSSSTFKTIVSKKKEGVDLSSNHKMEILSNLLVRGSEGGDSAYSAPRSYTDLYLKVFNEDFCSILDSLDQDVKNKSKTPGDSFESFKQTHELLKAVSFFEERIGHFSRRDFFEQVILDDRRGVSIKGKLLSRMMSRGRLIAEINSKIFIPISEVVNHLPADYQTELTSFFREPVHNALYKGARFSDHQSGNAVDMKIMFERGDNYINACHKGNGELFKSIYNAVVEAKNRLAGGGQTVFFYLEHDHLHISIRKNNFNTLAWRNWKQTKCPSFDAFVKNYCDSDVNKSCVTIQGNSRSVKVLDTAQKAADLVDKTKSEIESGASSFSIFSSAQEIAPEPVNETAPFDYDTPAELLFRSFVPGDQAELYQEIRGDNGFLNPSYYEQEFNFRTPGEFNSTTLFNSWFPGKCNVSFHKEYICHGMSNTDCHNYYHNVSCGATISVDGSPPEPLNTPTYTVRGADVPVKIRMWRTWESDTRDHPRYPEVARAYAVPIITYGTYNPERVGYEYKIYVRPAPTREEFLTQFMKFESGGRDYYFIGRLPGPDYYMDFIETPIRYMPTGLSVYHLNYHLDADPSGADYIIITASIPEE